MFFKSVKAALQFLTAFQQSPMAAFTDLKNIDVSAPEILVVTTVQGSEITFGLTELDQQIARWHSIFDMGQRIGKAIATLNLAIPNNIPARWLEASSVPATPPKALKPYHSKKRHV
jgi:hypothetical protein